MASPDALTTRMAKLRIYESDIVEKFVLGSGSGGQKVNKTSSCVYLKHLATGIEIKCQTSRSRETNRYTARTELCDRIEAQRNERQREAKQRREKLRRTNRQRSPRQKSRMLDDKSRQGQKKSLRRKVKGDE